MCSALRVSVSDMSPIDWLRLAISRIGVPVTGCGSALMPEAMRRARAASRLIGRSMNRNVNSDIAITSAAISSAA